MLPQSTKCMREYPGNCRSVSLISVPEKVMEKVVLEDFERHLKNKATIKHSQHSLMRGKSCLSNLISFYDRVTCLDEGKAVDVLFLDFRKVFLRLFMICLGKSQMSNFLSCLGHNE